MNCLNFTIQESHRNLALKCLTYLLLEDISDGPADTADDYVTRLQQLPFLKYAASAWPYHTKLAFSPAPSNSRTEARAMDDEILAVILEFFNPRRRGNFMVCFHREGLLSQGGSGVQCANLGL